MPHHSHSEKLDYTKLVESINALAKTVNDFIDSENRHHEAFLHSIQSLKPRIHRQSSAPLNSDHANATVLSLTPMISFKPLSKSSLIFPANQIKPSPCPSPPSSHSVAAEVALAPLLPFKPVTVLVDHKSGGIHKRTQPRCPSVVRHKSVSNVEDLSFTVGSFEPVPASFDVKVISHDLVLSITDDDLLLRDVVPISIETEHPGLPRETTHGVPDLLAALPPTAIPPPEPPDRLKVQPPPPWFTGHGSNSLVAAIARQIATATLAVKLPFVSVSSPEVRLFSFDSCGIRPVASYSAVRRPLLNRWFQLLQFPMASSPLSLFPTCSLLTNTPPSREPRSSSIQARMSPALASFSATVPLRGAASGWPWVPWRMETQNKLRVSMGLPNESSWFSLVVNLGLITNWISMGTSYKLKGNYREDLVADLGFLTCWALFLLKKEWATWVDLMNTCMFGFDTSLGLVLDWVSWLPKRKWAKEKLQIFFAYLVDIASSLKFLRTIQEEGISSMFDWKVPCSSISHHDLEDMISLKGSVMIHIQIMETSTQLAKVKAREEYSRIIIS